MSHYNLLCSTPRGKFIELEEVEEKLTTNMFDSLEEAKVIHSISLRLETFISGLFECG